ncbi:Diaminopimelate epimerase [bioreactor metagenome]|uniref:Diaminopimelate epimerase n=1 Tax=bioreactor metagenome TaxID=1076179 RepID=A0A644Y7X1_9ZZZZ
MSGSALLCMGKYLYDKGIVKKEILRIETGSGVKSVELYTMSGQVTSACVSMGKASLDAKKLPTALKEARLVDYPVKIGEKLWRITCVDMGNPHCVVFCQRVDGVDVPVVGPQFEHAEIFPERINTEFIRVVNESTIKMRVWERGSGETMACGSGACAAVVAAVAGGLCQKGRDITVKAAGGDLTVNYTDDGVTLTGDAKLVYEGVVEY